MERGEIIILIGVISIVLIVGITKTNVNTNIMVGDIMTNELNEAFCFEETCHNAGCNTCDLTKIETHEWYACPKLYADKQGNIWRQYWTCEDSDWGRGGK